MTLTGVFDFAEHWDGLLEGRFLDGDGFDAEIGHAGGIKHDGILVAWRGLGKYGYS